MIVTLLLLAAFICFAVEAWWHKSLIALGLACWTLSLILATHAL